VFWGRLFLVYLENGLRRGVLGLNCVERLGGEV